MIILRQNNYSSGFMRVIKTLKQRGNRAWTALDNAGLSASNAVREIATGRPTPHYMKAKFKPKTNTQINRETVQTVRSMREIPKEVYYTPGTVVDRGLKFAAGNPIAAAGQVGSVTLPVANPIFLGIPIGSPSVAIETAAKQWKPYSAATERLANRYGGSGVSRSLKGMPSLPEMAGQFGNVIPM